MHGDESRSALDALIDDVARAITSGGPSRSLRARVAERIVAQRIAWPIATWKPALAAVSIVLIVALVWPRIDERVERSAARPSVPTDVGAPVPADVGAAVLTSVKLAHTGDEPLTEPVTTSPIEPIEVAPLPIEPIGPEPVVLDAVAVPMPVTIEQLRIEPIPVGEVGHELE